MEIRTKFKPKDKIWLIDYDSENGSWFVRGSYKIWKIFVQVFNDTQDIQYGLLRDDNYYWYMQEKNCFATKEEAQAECDKRNKGEEK